MQITSCKEIILDLSLSIPQQKSQFEQSERARQRELERHHKLKACHLRCVPRKHEIFTPFERPPCLRLTARDIGDPQNAKGKQESEIRTAASLSQKTVPQKTVETQKKGGHGSGSPTEQLIAKLEADLQR